MKKPRSSRKPILKVDIVTLFPSMFNGPLTESLMGRAQAAGLIKINVHNLRNWAEDKKRGKVDDRPYGGGAGMVIQAEPLYQALKELGGISKGRKKAWVVFLSPQGRMLKQKTASDLSKRRQLILICGHYEGIDERIMEWVDEEVSIGNYVVTGGELPAMVLCDAVCRLVPGVVGDPTSLENESFSIDLLDYPHYTRPQRWRNRNVPSVLVSGNHAEIHRWRRAQALKQTKKKRPDLLRIIER